MRTMTPPPCVCRPDCLQSSCPVATHPCTCGTYIRATAPSRRHCPDGLSLNDKIHSNLVLKHQSQSVHNPSIRIPPFNRPANFLMIEISPSSLFLFLFLLPRRYHRHHRSSARRICRLPCPFLFLLARLSPISRSRSLEK